MATTASKRAAKKTAKTASERPSKRRSASTPASGPEVRGLILDLGDPLSAAERRKIIAQLRADVPEFAALTTAKSIARPLGKGASDVLVAFHDSERVSVAQAWNAVHALRPHPLLADCEPAVRIRATAPEPQVFATRSSGGGDRDLPGSLPRDWSLKAVGADRARAQFGVTGAGVRVGHPDTGYTAHPQIAGPRLRIGDGYDFVADAADPRDPMTGSHPGHGTATASVIFSGATDLHGVAPGAEVVPLRVSDSVIHFDFANVAEALYRARDRGCHLVSMSLGGPWAGRALERAVDRVIADGLILLAAAGNQWPFVVYPAKLDNVVGVAASNADTKPWRGSASGAAVDITAPGESVWRAYAHKVSGALRFDTERSNGTSYATATTAGVCALWLQRHGVAALRARYGGRLASVFMDLLKTHCRTVPGWNTRRYGPGLVDAAALMAAPLPAFGGAVMRSASRAPTRSTAAADWARLQPYLPELTPKQLASAATKMFAAGETARGGMRAAAVGRPAPPPSLIDEIEFHVATDPAVRAAFLAAGGMAAKPRKTTANRAATKSAVSRAKAAIDPLGALRAKASAALREALTEQ
ncbi:S8/S53 family peptidase [Lysobacter hankyongensis]|uniref:Peptidase S8/S53 domain-containing protein n=1 Tax=Lysobacter hankyongensis TaxID=1176535 RepID=A0ABP9B8K7_9GAMM